MSQVNVPEYWKLNKNKLTRDFSFKDFSEAFAFLTRVAILAETKQHHPEIFNVWNKVTLNLSTHDAGDMVTEKDIDLAFEINKLISV